MTQSAAHPWLDRIIASQSLDELCRLIKSQTDITAQGSWGSSATIISGALSIRLSRPVLLVVAHLDDADDALEDLELFSHAGHELPCYRFGALEVMPGESAVSLELLAERLAIVDQLIHAQQSFAGPGVLVAPIQALMQAVPQPDALVQFHKTLKPGLVFPPNKLIDWLVSVGYNRTDAIEQPGDFATRGGIVDLYLPSTGAASIEQTGSENSAAPSGPLPIRLDYFGDQIESIRLVDTESMGSGRSLLSVQVIGASAKQIQSDEQTLNLLSLLPSDAIVVMLEVLELAEQARGYYERITNPRGIYAPNTLMQLLTKRLHVQINQYSSTAKREDAFAFPVRALTSFSQDAGTAMKELAELGQTPAGSDASAKPPEVIALCHNAAESERLGELLNEHAPNANVDRIIGQLHRGFVWDETTSSPDASEKNVALHIVTHHELFHRYQNRRRIRRISASALSSKASDAFMDLDVGDYVVHADHGIARFVGLRTLKKNPEKQGETDKSSADPISQEEYLTLEFAGRALLHVPATQIDLVQKYVGGFEGKPPLSTLGGKRWQKQKEQVQEAVKDMAAELIRVQAARASMPGVRYPADTTWQREFEAEFPYEETQDQLAAIAAIKKDMSDEQPMDRLICGDVGFGKTEVAIRAAFKAAEFGKQVAVLVPTTVLAEQHERSFRDRMADYPFRVASVSRFKTAGEQKQLLRELSEGKIDIIIGTHRLLSADVQFPDLGLVIVDEEQRFGVEHKHKLLQYRMTVDVLTLSATPIPRTLHMSMLGLRDISSLSMAPADRRAVVTEVVPYEPQRIQQAMVRELARDGQIFFVHNRVHNIQSVADDIQKLVPEAKIVIGHGQMPSHELEAVMLKFMRKEADILVATTIIESGIDIPTANTIFINQCDMFGLADLHQLRGRVGRYKHRAYCYLLLPEDRPITEIATRRLKALEQYSMLGAGFKIAMRDLEIRGAGNLLGAEQSGHIAAVGYDMYCAMLEQAVKKLRNERVIEPVKTHLELPGSKGRIPSQYISSDKFRMEAYRRVSRASTLVELDQVEHDMRDAYGDPPAQVRAMLDITEIRIAASTLEIQGIKLNGSDLIFRTQQPQKLNEIFAGAPGRVSLVDETTIYYRPPPNYLEPATVLAVLRKLLVRRVKAVNTPASATSPILQKKPISPTKRTNRVRPPRGA